MKEPLDGSPEPQLLPVVPPDRLPAPAWGYAPSFFFPEADYKPINKTCSHLTCFMALLAALLHNQFGEVGKSALLMLNTCTSTQKEARKRFIGGNIKPSLP